MKFNINKKSPVPLYYQLAGELENKITCGEVGAGERLPGTMELAGVLKINPLTVNKAFSVLVEKGLVERRRRAGTFVNGKFSPSMPSVGFFYFLEAEEVMSERAELIQCILSDKGYQLKIVPYREDYFDKFDFNEEIGRRNIRGAVISGVPSPSCREVLKELENRGFPFVMLGSHLFPGELNSPVIRGNETQCVREVLDYFWELGHRRIGLVSYWKNDEVVREYESFYEERGGYEERWKMSIEFSGPGRVWKKKFPGQQIARGYLEENRDITALVVEHISACIDFVRQAKVSDRAVPEELSIFCLRDREVLQVVEPSVSAMHLPLEEMVRAAVEELFREMKSGGRKEERVTMVDYRLVERESTTGLLSAVN